MSWERHTAKKTIHLGIIAIQMKLFYVSNNQNWEQNSIAWVIWEQREK